jgi:hypothetical protein
VNFCQFNLHPDALKNAQQSELSAITFREDRDSFNQCAFAADRRVRFVIVCVNAYNRARFILPLQLRSTSSAAARKPD